LRPVIIGLAIMAAIWSGVWGINAFENISPDSQNVKSLVPFDIILGSLYIGVTAIEIFGAISAFLQNLALIRLYSLLTLIAALLVSGAEMLRIVIHFKFKSTIISQCITFVMSDNDDDGIGFFGSHHANGLSQADATSFCNQAWNHDTFADIAWFIISIILTLLFSSIAFAYYNQLLDPSSASTRMPRNRNRQQDNFPLETFTPSLPYNSNQEGTSRYNPPPGPPPSESPFAPPYEASKLPKYGYSEDGHAKDDGKKATDDEKDLAGVNY